MKKALLFCLAASMLLSACASNAVAAVSAQSASVSQSSEAASKPDASGMPERPGGQREQNGVMGKITAVSGTEITIILAGTDRVERGTPPSGDNASRSEEKPSEPPADASRPEKPSGEQGGGRGSTEFTGETVTYTLAGDVVIQKGADNDGAISISDLAVDDVVRIELDDSGQVASIRLMNMDNAGGQPPEKPANKSEAG